MDQNHLLRASIFFIITTIFWGLNYHWGKDVLTQVDPFEGAFWRYVIATTLLGIFTVKNFPTIRLIKENWVGLIKIGGIGLVGFNYFFFKGMEQTTPVNAALIVGLNPAVTLILASLILKSSISIKQIIGILIALAGVLYLLFEGDLQALVNLEFKLGDGLILLACIFFALHHVWVKKYSHEGITNAQLSFLAAAVCFLCFIMINIFHVSTSPESTAFQDISTYSRLFWMSAIGIGGLGTAVAYWFWYKGIAIAGAAKAAVFVNIVPLSSAIAYVLKGSELESFHIISGLIIIAGILIMQLRFGKVKMPSFTF